MKIKLTSRRMSGQKYVHNKEEKKEAMLKSKLKIILAVKKQK